MKLSLTQARVFSPFRKDFAVTLSFDVGRIGAGGWVIALAGRGPLDSPTPTLDGFLRRSQSPGCLGYAMLVCIFEYVGNLCR